MLTLGAQFKPNAQYMDANPLLDNFEDLVITHADDNGRLDLSLLTDNNFDTTETTRIVNVQIDRSAFVADPSNGDGQQHGATIQRPSGAGLGGSTVRLAHTGAAVTAVFMLAAVTLTSGLVLIAGRRLRHIASSQRHGSRFDKAALSGISRIPLLMKASNTVPVMIAAVVAAAIMYPREESMIPAIPDANEASDVKQGEHENTRPRKSFGMISDA